MLKNQAEAFNAVEKALPEINNVIEKITQKLKKMSNSRLIYAGAGTSARIGLQDAVELYPTFGWPRNRINFIIAGGLESLTKSLKVLKMI